MRSLVWLASFPKSGNTWTRSFVAAYLLGPDKFSLERVNQFSRSESLLALFSEVAGKPADELTDADINEYRLATQERLAETIGKRVVKTHNARLTKDSRRQVFSRYTKAGIYVVRNPLDVVDSFADHTNKSIDEAIELMNHPNHRLGATNKHASQYVGTWSHHARTWINNANEFPLIVLRYEDLKSDPIGQFGKLIKFLRWDYNEQRIRQAAELTSFESLKSSEEQQGFAETSTVAKSGKFFRHGESGRWREVLTPAQIDRVVKNHGPMMEKLGYEIPSTPRKRVVATKRAQVHASAEPPVGAANQDLSNKIVAYEIYRQNDMPLSPAPVNRQWMDDSQQRFAYRCLPLTLANQAGWVIANPTAFEASWTGGPLPSDVTVKFDNGRDEKRISSLFGHGTVTINMPYLFRTPKNMNLWVKGPTNSPKDGVHPLEGIVETDWTAASFTMNWKLTRPNHAVRFEVGEPICMIVPYPRGLLDSVAPMQQPLDSNAEVADAYKRWSIERDEFQRRVAAGDMDAIKTGWQKDYFQGRDPGSERTEAHQTKLIVRPFVKSV